MAHIVLLGDSIFDNGAYVPRQPPLIEQLRAGLPHDWRATLLAVDGDSVADVEGQLAGLSKDATHLFLSAGGNDALNESAILRKSVGSVAEAADLIARAQARFRADYQRLLSILRSAGERAAVCTVYDAIPGLGGAERATLAVYNDVILRCAFSLGMPVIDLRLVCDKAEDYSDISNIEPSAKGGAKIARVITEVSTQHDFSRRQTVVYR